MADAFIMIDTAAGMADEVLSELRAIDSVTDAHIVAGDFDIIAEVHGDVVRNILLTVTREIRTLEGVGTTKTYVSLD